MSYLNRIFKPPTRKAQTPPAAVTQPPALQPDTPPIATAGLRRVPIRVTGPEDGELLNRGYSYWPQGFIKDSIGAAFLFVGHADGRPRWFKVDLQTGAITRLGALLDYIGTAEGWYWTSDGRVMIAEGSRLHQVNPFNPGEDVVVFEAGFTFANCSLWQCHSSKDGRTHSMTVRQPTEDGPYLKLGTVVARDGALLRFESPTLGELDESAISANGRYLLIKEGEDDDNRIFDLDAGTERVIRKADGALGHSDNGPDWAIGDDRTQGGATWINLANPDERRVLVRFPDWNMGHVSVQAGRCLLTHGELITLLDPQTGSIEVICPHGMTGSGYDHQVFANLDPTARLACYVSDAAGRMDLYVVIL